MDIGSYFYAAGGNGLYYVGGGGHVAHVDGCSLDDYFNERG